MHNRLSHNLKCALLLTADNKKIQDILEETEFKAFKNFARPADTLV